MSANRRIQDALSSPTRLFWFVVRTIYLALTGRITLSIARLFPHTLGAPNYQKWIAETETRQDLSHVLDPSVLAAPPVAFVIATTGATMPNDIISGSELRGRALLNCWMTCTKGAAWRPPVHWVPRPSSAALGHSLQLWTILEVLADVERQTSLPIWVIFVAEDIVLEPNFLAIIATTARSWPMARLIYADHDQISDGRRHHPVFKPAWDPIQMQERNFVGGACAIEGSLLRRVRWRSPNRYLDVQALILECSRVVQPGEALHIPRILWHHLDGTGVGEEPASKPALEQPIRRQSLLVRGDLPLVSVIIPARDHIDLTRRCVDSLLSQTQGCAYEILLVDNDSLNSATWKYYAEELEPKGVQLLLYPGAFNFSELCNAGAASSRGRVLVFLNNDTEIISPDWLTELSSLAMREECGAVGPLLLHADGTIQHAGILMGLNGGADRPLVNLRPEHGKASDWCSARRVVSAVLGACLAIERDKYCAIGGMDPLYAVSHNEVDLCLRLALTGYVSVFTPHVRLIHLESGTRGYDLTPSQRGKLHHESDRFATQWGQRSHACDPAYHPNFRRDGNLFALASEVPPCLPREGWDAAALSREAGQATARRRPSLLSRSALSG